jgi:hypothetical protein
MAAWSVAVAAFALTWGLTGSSGAQAGDLADVGSPMHCITYNVGADTHTDCFPGPASPPGTSIQCYNYTVGTDMRTACAAVPATQLGPLRGKIVSPPLVVPPHCITYSIGTSRYVECR